MPKSSLQRQEFGHKKPYLVASIFSLALVVFAIYKAEGRIGNVWRGKEDEIKAPLARLTAADQSLNTALGERKKLEKQADDMKSLSDNRFYWIRVLTDLRKVMMQAEAAEKAHLITPDNHGTNTDVGVWVEKFEPDVPDAYEAGQQAPPPGMGGGGMMMGRGGFGGFGGYGRYGSRYERYGRYAPPPGPMPSQTPGRAPIAPSALGVNEITSIKLTCRGVNRTTTANFDLAYAVRRFLNESSAFTNAALVGDIEPGQDANTFTFEMTVDLMHHFKL